MITVKHGPNQIDGDMTAVLAGKTISQVRMRVALAVGLPEDSTKTKATVNGASVGESYIVGADDTIDFVAPAGEKG